MVTLRRRVHTADRAYFGARLIDWSASDGACAEGPHRAADTATFRSNVGDREHGQLCAIPRAAVRVESIVGDELHIGKVPARFVTTRPYNGSTAFMSEEELHGEIDRAKAL